ncbi:MAG: NYN domain-containing protein [Planctomycetes bacterium]|nr:NYN domain-containing protein [Planctomycetota bacterium]
MTQDRMDRRAEEALNDPGNRVALFLDYENIRHSTEHGFSPPPSAQVLCEKLYELATRFGRVLMANAYADWQVAAIDPREFRRRMIEPRLVLTKENGDDRTDITMSLDALETLYDEPAIDVYVIASGDSDFHDLLQRLRRRGKRIVVCGARSDTGRELIRSADKYVPLDDLLGVRPARASAPVDWEAYDWTGFVRLIRDLSRKLTFVGLRYVATKVLNPHNCGLSDRTQKQELLNRAIDLGIIEAYQVDNIEEGGDPVSACRLSPDHPVVREALQKIEADEGPGEVVASGGTVSPGPAPARPRHEPLDSDDIGRPGESAI